MQILSESKNLGFERSMKISDRRRKREREATEKETENTVWEGGGEGSEGGAAISKTGNLLGRYCAAVAIAQHPRTRSQ